MNAETKNIYTWEDLVKANATIKTTDIKGKDYAEVNQRIKAFRMLCPHGSIVTELVSNENGVCVFRANIVDEDGKVLGTGTAYEKESSSYINKTSYIENCETSAVGRALGMCGFGIDTSVASYEEVANAIKNQDKSGEKGEPKTPDYRKMLIAELKNRGIDVKEFSAKHHLSKDTTQDDFRDLYEDLIGEYEGA